MDGPLEVAVADARKDSDSARHGGEEVGRYTRIALEDKAKKGADESGREGEGEDG